MASIGVKTFRLMRNGLPVRTTNCMEPDELLAPSKQFVRLHALRAAYLIAVKGIELESIRLWIAYEHSCSAA
jgi:hypothetical protein